MSREYIHVHRTHIFASRALKLSLYFIGRAYKSKASASQILEDLHTPIRGCDAQNADTCRSIGMFQARLFVSTYARVPRTLRISTVNRDETISHLLALRIIISQMMYL